MITPPVSPSDEPFQIVLFGDPVAHTISPAMHNAAFHALDLPGLYVARRVAREDVSTAVAAVRRPPYRGANVTLPHKEAIARLVDSLTERASVIGAVNTVVREGDRLHGDNTDAQGLLAALESSLGVVPYGLRIVLLGAGGAARAAAVALLSGGPAGLTIYNRTADHATSLAAAMRERFGGRVRAADADAARAEAAEADLIVNATSAGLDGTSVPLEGLQTRPGAALYDMVYTPSPTPLMRHLSAQGAHVADGLDMLIFQAAASFALWTGHEAPVAVMRGAALAELRRRRGTAGGHVALIGLSGSGKSTVGRLLAQLLNRPLYDSDELLAARAGTSVPDLLRANAVRFRALEEDVVREVCASPAGVIATGGGVVLSSAGRAALREGNMVVWLRAPVPELAARLRGGEERPLLADEPAARLAEMARERDALYAACAHDVVDTEHLTAAQVAQRVHDLVATWEAGRGR